MKVAIVFTGGTIGSVISGDTIDVDVSARELLLDYINGQITEEVTFVVSQPLNILSENMIPKHWGIIYEHVKALLFQDYTGIIIAHGSDTLPYTAAMLSYMLGHTRIPILLTGSNYPLEDVRSNGRSNMLNCIRFIMEQIPGIFTIFQNEKRESVVYLGTRMLEAVHITDEFQSFGDIYFGKMLPNGFSYHHSPVNPTIDQLKQRRGIIEFEGIQFEAPIMVIKPYPGLNYQFYRFGEHKPKAIIHDLYHSATHNTLEELPNESLVNYIKYCTSEGVDVYLVPFRKLEEKMYLSSKKLMDAGAKPLRNISLIGVITKLILAYSYYKQEQERNAFIEQRIFYEYLNDEEKE